MGFRLLTARGKIVVKQVYYTNVKQWDIMTRSYPKVDNGLNEPTFKLGKDKWLYPILIRNMIIYPSYNLT